MLTNSPNVNWLKINQDSRNLVSFSREFSEKISSILENNRNAFDFSFMNSSSYWELISSMEWFLSPIISNWLWKIDYLDSYQSTLDLELNSITFNEKKLNEKKLNEKIRKNLIIYLPSIVWEVYNRLWLNTTKKRESIDFSNPDVKKVLSKVCLDFTLIIFTFWDSISIDFISSSLKLSRKKISETYNWFNKISISLSDDEELSLKEECTLSDMVLFKDIDLEIEEDLFWKKYLATMYRNIYRDTFEPSELSSCEWEEDYEIKKEERETRIKLKIKDELKKMTQNIYCLYVKISDTENDSEKNIKLIHFLYIKLKVFFKTLKENNLLSITIEDENDLIETSDIFNYLWLEKFLKDDCFLIALTSWKYTKSSIEKKSSNDLIDIDIDFFNTQIWAYHTKFLKETLWVDNENPDIKDKLLSIIWKKPDKELKKLFSDKYGISIDVVTNQLSSIRNFLKSNEEKITIVDFINNDINHFIFIYNYYRFKEIYDNKNIEDSKKDELYKKIIENDGFSTLLNESTSEELIFSSKWQYNTTSEWFLSTTKNIIDNFSRWYIDIESTSIDIYEKWKKVNNLALYSVNSFYSAGSDASSEESFDYINNAIDTCISLKQWKKNFDSNDKYISLLKRFWIIPKDLSDLSKTKNAYENLWKLICWLKLVLYKAHQLQNIVEKSPDGISKLLELLWEDFIKNRWYDNRTQSWVWPEKIFWRWLEKLISKYNWDIHSLWDFVRWRIICNDIDSLCETVDSVMNKLKQSKDIESISLDDQFWDIFSLSKKKSWFRDLKIDIKFKSWITAELQIQLEDMTNAKVKWVNLDDFDHKKLKEEWALLKEKELLKVLSIYNKAEWKKVSYHIANIIYDWNLDDCKNEDIKKLLNHTEDKSKIKLSWDNTYHVIRSLISKDDNLSNSIKNKLTRIERLIFEKSWKQILLKYVFKK